MITVSRTLYGYREQVSARLQGAGLCMVKGSRSLQGYRDEPNKISGTSPKLEY